MTVSEAISHIEENEFDSIEEICEYLDENNIDYDIREITHFDQEIIILDKGRYNDKVIIHFLFDNEVSIDDANSFCERYGKDVYTWQIEECDEHEFYHRTNSGKHILNTGLTFFSRGGTLGNKHIHNVIFASTDEDGFRQYGKDLVKIDAYQLKKDGFPLKCAYEPDSWEALASEYLADELGINLDIEFNYEDAWSHPSTRILFPNEKLPKDKSGYHYIPSRYLSLEDYEEENYED